MSHYVLVDGILQKASPETKRWHQRAARAVPSNTEEPKDVLALPTEDKRSDWEVIEGLEETPEMKQPYLENEGLTK
jgi:hypothetical protein